MCSLPSHGTTWDPRTIPFLFYLKPHRLHNTPIPERVWVKQTPKIYVCVVGNPPLLTLNPPILNTHFLAPFPIMPRPPFEKQMGNWPVLPWQAFLPFPKKKQGGNRFREMRLGMSKRKNEVVFTLIQEGNPKILSLFLIIPTCGWKGTLFVTDVLHST